MSMNTALTFASGGVIPQQVLPWLLTHEAAIPNRIVKDFVLRYIKRLSTCSQEQPDILSGGDIKLQRWHSEEDGGSYGYDPSHVAYAYGKLNRLFWGIMTDALRRHSLPSGAPEKGKWPELFLPEELLKNIASCFGFSLLVSYFTSSVSNNQPGKQWFARLMQIAGEFEDMDTWRPNILVDQVPLLDSMLDAPESSTSPYYNTKRIEQRKKAAHSWLSIGEQPYLRTERVREIGWLVLEEERKRLVSFMRSLRQTIEVLQDDPLMVNSQWQVITANGHQIP